eukprot:TRINITY_DN5305_c0_g1_i2.p1 TRINITY_DN5305_c0_g1~~TRINITY_DN5305_c0_g1_i2.p1  ORF type:complete len:739 (-),score=111.62 TRINITY_DN5305_c0_g1_i2:222-2438(-)
MSEDYDGSYDWYGDGAEGGYYDDNGNWWSPVEIAQWERQAASRKAPPAAPANRRKQQQDKQKQPKDSNNALAEAMPAPTEEDQNEPNLSSLGIAEAAQTGEELWRPDRGSRDREVPLEPATGASSLRPPRKPRKPRGVLSRGHPLDPPEGRTWGPEAEQVFAHLRSLLNKNPQSESAVSVLRHLRATGWIAPSLISAQILDDPAAPVMILAGTPVSTLTGGLGCILRGDHERGYSVLLPQQHHQSCPEYQESVPPLKSAVSAEAVGGPSEMDSWVTPASSRCQQALLANEQSMQERIRTRRHPERKEEGESGDLLASPQPAAINAVVQAAKLCAQADALADQANAISPGRLSDPDQTAASLLILARFLGKHWKRLQEPFVHCAPGCVGCLEVELPPEALRLDGMLGHASDWVMTASDDDAWIVEKLNAANKAYRIDLKNVLGKSTPLRPGEKCEICMAVLRSRDGSRGTHAGRRRGTWDFVAESVLEMLSDDSGNLLDAGGVGAVFDWLHNNVVVHTSSVPPPIDLLVKAGVLLDRLIQDGGALAVLAFQNVDRVDVKIDEIRQRYWKTLHPRDYKKVRAHLDRLDGLCTGGGLVWSFEDHQLFPSEFKTKCAAVAVSMRHLWQYARVLETLCDALASCPGLDWEREPDVVADLNSSFGSHGKDVQLAVLKAMAAEMPTLWLKLNKLAGKDLTKIRNAQFKKIWAACVVELNGKWDRESKVRRKVIMEAKSTVIERSR